jgi:putative transposase
MLDALKDEYPVRQLCETLGCPPSTYYYQSQAASDADLMAAMEDELMRRPFYGYRRVLRQLQRAGWQVGETRVRRVLKQMGHTAQIGRVRVRTTDSSHSHGRYPNLLKQTVVQYPDQVWVADITYLRLGHRFIYLAVILDAYTRGARLGAQSRHRRRPDAGRAG